MTGGPSSELERLRAELRGREHEVARLAAELDETNRGVLALYAELDDRALELRRASELKSRFLSGISHELRTPLNSILNVARLLLDRLDGDLTPEQEHQVELMRQSAASLSEMVNDLLDLARIEAGRAVIRIERFTVSALFGSLRGICRPLLRGDAVQLHFETAPGVAGLQTDEGKVGQVLRNLIANAIRFTEQGKIVVSAEPAGDGWVAFRVSDTGIGIAPEDQERIFEEYSQVESPMQRRSIGSGLGLPLSRRLARLLGGALTVESRPGLGATFEFRIPTVFPAESAEDAVEIVAEEGAHG